MTKRRNEKEKNRKKTKRQMTKNRKNKWKQEGCSEIKRTNKKK